MSFYSALVYLHSGFRYIVFIFVILSVCLSAFGWFGKKPYTAVDKRVNLYGLISAHTQLLIGIVLYIVSPNVQFNSSTMKTESLRYYTVEHWVGMLIAIILITIGYSRSKKIILPAGKHKVIVTYYLLAILIIFATILAGHLPLI